MTQDAEKVYRALVAEGPLTTRAAAGACRIGLPEAALALAALRRSGLVSHGRGADGREVWEPSPPSLALGAMLAMRQDELRALAGEISELEGTYREASGRRDDGGAVEVLHGSETVAHRFLQLQQGARDEMLCLMKGKSVVVSAQENKADSMALARGVRARLVADEVAAHWEPDDVYSGIAQGVDVRISEEVPTKMLVIDREIALLPLHDDPARLHDRAVIVRASGIVAALVGLFEQTWARSRPVLAEGRGEGDAALLALMLGGLTDEAIAQRLGASARTVQRRIKRLMERGGATTRFQLGWYARDMGWSTTPEREGPGGGEAESGRTR
ncbi:helix-turn-helix domain-containing protein [Streptomyces sp. NPDC002932]|uniref:helix-turn-helix domain-containing protein n=1 Tax=Streptomyces sp. NPDC002932 TaxID=3364672 RepID=UPI0036CBDD20